MLDCSLGPEALKLAPAEPLREWKCRDVSTAPASATTIRPSSSRCPAPARGPGLRVPSLTIGTRCLAFAHRMGETDAGAYRRGP